MKKKLNIKKFTLIELIIVIVVIGILAGMALPKFIGTTKDAKVSAMDQDLDVLEKAVQLYESTNDGAEPFVKDGSGNYAKVSVTRQTLKDTLDAIGDDESSVYTLNMEDLKPYLERLKYTDTYLYSTKTGVAINEQGKIDSSGVAHHILNGLNSTSSGSTTTTTHKITLMNNSENSTTPFVMIDNSSLYGWGSNYYGTIGDGSQHNINTPKTIILASGIKPKQIVCGGNHSMAIGSDGELYTWGSNFKGQLGNNSNTDDNYSPTKITLASGIKPTQIACGSKHAMAIGSDGELYTWGGNNHGQLGTGTKDTFAHCGPIQISLPNGVKPKQISCGYDFSMAIGSDNQLYAWGYNGDGELGDNTTTDKLTPTKITLASGVTQIVCGYEHSMAIGSDGELYTWGWNSCGDLGNGMYSGGIHIPTKIELAARIKPTQIACGYKYSMAVGSDGELYTWGDNKWGQLCDGTTYSTDIPMKVTLANGVTSDEFVNGELSKVSVTNGVKPKQIACGSCYAMVIGSDDKLYVSGTNNPIE